MFPDGRKLLPIVNNSAVVSEGIFALEGGN
jgi:hypothetical protein